MGNRRDRLEFGSKFGKRTGRLYPLGIDRVDGGVGWTGHKLFYEVENVRALPFGGDQYSTVDEILDITDDSVALGLPPGEVAEVDALYAAAECKTHCCGYRHGTARIRILPWVFYP